MNAFAKHATNGSKAVEAPRLVEVTVEQLTVYRYHVPDDADDLEEAAKARFLAGEKPDAGSADGDQHELATYVVGEVEPTPPADLDEWAETYRPVINGHRPDAPFDGLMFETFGDELKTVAAATPGCVWTLVQGDDRQGSAMTFGRQRERYEMGAGNAWPARRPCDAKPTKSALPSRRQGAIRQSSGISTASEPVQRNSVRK